MRRLTLPALWLSLFAFGCGCAATTTGGAGSLDVIGGAGRDVPVSFSVDVPTKPEGACPATLSPPPSAPGAAWYRRAVFYEVFVRSFRDSDGDGTGDLRGLIDKLDYLNDGDPTTDDDLGVTAIWLMPITSSPSYHGYDTVDYRAVDSDYGDLREFDALVTAAHDRGIKVVMDLVLNHTSDEHPWFAQASAGPDAPYRTWYVWADEQPGWTRPWSDDPVWFAEGGAYYYALFSSHMPDLNFRTQAVRDEAVAIARFWLERGLDGFRLDAARYLIEDGGGAGQSDTADTLAFWRWYRGELQATYPDAAFIGELWTGRANITPYFGSGEVGGGGDGLHMAFDFDLQGAIQESLAFGRPEGIRDTLCQAAQENPSFSQYGTFLANHDQTRIATQLGGDPQLLRLASALLLTLPGSPFLYYGEEIGLPNGPTLSDEDKRRPMRWDDSATGGFTEGDPSAVFPPLSMGGGLPDVASETGDADSLLSHYRGLLKLRRSHPALLAGRTELVPSEWLTNDRVLAFVRTAGDERLLVLHNLSAAPVEELTIRLAGLELLPAGALSAERLWGEADATRLDGGSISVPLLPGRASLVLAL